MPYFSEFKLSHITAADRSANERRSQWYYSDARKNQHLPAGEWDTAIWLAGRGFGKALALDTLVPTPSGWTVMGDIKVGDILYDENKKECVVTHAFPVRLDRPCYKLTIGKETVIADEDHEWLTHDHAARALTPEKGFPYTPPKIRTTKEIAESIMMPTCIGDRYDRYHMRLNHSIYCNQSDNHYFISDAVIIGSVPVRCIKVNSPSSLFLVSRAMIPTHNTRTLTEAAWWEAYTYPGIRIHALAPTLGDIHRVVFEGESGFLSVMPPELKKRYNKQDRELELINGSLITGFSVVEEADRLRGPQCHFLTFDEAAAADRPAGNLEAAYKVAALGVRLPYPDGRPSRKLIATTPRPIPFLKRLCKRPGVIVTQGSSLENRANVSVSVMNEILSMEGTLYGRQEIYGEFIDEVSDLSIWKRPWFKLWPADKPLPDFQFVLASYDTACSPEHYDYKKQTTDPTACIVLGVFNIAQVFDETERKRMGISRLRCGVLLCDAWSERLGFPDLLERARETYKMRWGKGKRKADIILIEDKMSGICLRQSLIEHGIPTWPYNPHRESKTMRAHAIAPLIKDGVFFVIESNMENRKGLPRDWAEMFLDQVCAFAGPGSVEYDDWVDAASQALIYLKDRDMLTGAPVTPYIDYEDERAAEMEKAQREYGALRGERSRNPYG